MDGVFEAQHHFFLLKRQLRAEWCRAVILNWWVADPFSVGRGPLPGQKKKLKKYNQIKSNKNPVLLF